MAQKPTSPKGTRDFGPREMERRNFILSTIRAIYEIYGFSQIETPAMENLSVLQGKYGEEGDQLLFKILNSGDFLKNTTEGEFQAGAKTVLPKISEKGLRYDLTVPFARFVVANQHNLTFPFRRYQVQPVWRADRPQKGRYREFYQFDADVIGSDSLLFEAEFALIVNDVFTQLGITEYTIKINNRKILQGLAEAMGHSDKMQDLAIALDKIDKIGQQKVNEELEQRGFDNSSIAQLEQLLQITDLLQLEKELPPAGQKGIQEVQEVLNTSAKMGLEPGILDFDVSLARGLSYYTGAIFEVKVTNVKIGSVAAGGRYDDLTGLFGLPDVSGVGLSFGVDRIYDVMTELDLFNQKLSDRKSLMITNFGSETRDYCLQILSRIRKQGIRCEWYPEPAKMKKQFSYADKQGIKNVLIIGPDEAEKGMVTLKDMLSGEQKVIRFEQIIDEIAK